MLVLERVEVSFPSRQYLIPSNFNCLNLIFLIISFPLIQAIPINYIVNGSQAVAIGVNAYWNKSIVDRLLFNASIFKLNLKVKTTSHHNHYHYQPFENANT